MASRQTTSKNAQKKGASRKAAPKQGAAKLRANAQAAPEPVPEPLFTGGTARDISGVVLAVFAVASFIAVIAPTTAPVAAAVAGFYHLGFGLGGYVLPLALLFVSALVFVRDEGVFKMKTALGALLIFVAVISFIALVGLPDPMVLGVTVSEAGLSATGGYVGFAVSSVLAGALGKPIAGVVLVGIALAGAVLIGFSISSFAGAVRERVEGLRARRHVEVNERPWGDDPYAEVPVRESNPKGAPAGRQQKLFDEDGTAKTTYIGDRAKTMLITDDPDDPDEDPFVDVSEQLKAEAAKTRLIPIEDKHVSAEHAVAGNVTAASSAADDPYSLAGMTEILESGDDCSDEPPFDLSVETGVSAATQAVTSPAEGRETQPPIPDFLLHPRASSAGEGASKGAGAASVSPAVEPARADADSQDDDEERKLPPLSMLRHNPHSASSASSDKELRQTAESLQSTLQEFNLHSQVVGWISGPTVTTFKVQPGEGERVSRISSLEDDIALSRRSPCASSRPSRVPRSWVSRFPTASARM